MRALLRRDSGEATPLKALTYLTALMAALALSTSASAQGVIEQVGPVTPGHQTCWLQNGFVLDCAMFPSTTVTVLTSGSPTLGNCGNVLVVNKTVGGATAVTLPASASGCVYVVKDGKGDANTNNITITPTSGLIDGAGTKVLNTSYGKVTVIFDGTNWDIIA
jgi:hypothetical protein